MSLNFDKKPADPVSRYPKKAALTDIFVVFSHRRFSYSSKNSPKSFTFTSPLAEFSQFTLYSQTFDARLYADSIFPKNKIKKKRTSSSNQVELSLHSKLHKKIQHYHLELLD